MKAFLRSRPVQYMLARFLGHYLRFILLTNRWTLDGAENFAPQRSGASAVFSFWHEYLPLMPAMVMLARRFPGYRAMPIHTLVSLHRDGQFIGTVVRQLGIEPVPGSSTRGGSAGFRQLLAVLRRGALIGLTPDGPRGPRREAAPGVARLAAAAGVPVLPCAARTTRRIALRSWDKMEIPLPFGRGFVVCGPEILVSRDSWRDAVPTIAAAMNRVADQADRLRATA